MKVCKPGIHSTKLEENETTKKVTTKRRKKNAKHITQHSERGSKPLFKGWCVLCAHEKKKTDLKPTTYTAGIKICTHTNTQNIINTVQERHCKTASIGISYLCTLYLVRKTEIKN